MRYREKLKDPRWQQRSQAKIAIAGHECEDCEAKHESLQVHHIQYVSGREPWDYSDMELVCCCRKCHVRREETAREARVLFQMAEPADCQLLRASRPDVTGPGDAEVDDGGGGDLEGCLWGRGQG